MNVHGTGRKRLLEKQEILWDRPEKAASRVENSVEQTEKGCKKEKDNL
jgi:hypothetical protein